MDDLDSVLPMVIANLRARHPEMVGQMDDETIRRRFCSFHDEHDMCKESFQRHIDADHRCAA